MGNIVGQNKNQGFTNKDHSILNKENIVFYSLSIQSLLFVSHLSNVTHETLVSTSIYNVY